MNNESCGDDANLVEACVNRDMMAWSHLITKYSKLIFISIEDRLKKRGLKLSRQDIEDIHQNVLTLLWDEKKLEGVVNRKDISYWLAIVSGNTAIEYTRRLRARQASGHISLFEKLGERELSELIPSSSLNPSDEISRNELSNRIESALESLSDKERLLIKLNILHDKKYREIADILNMPKGTISSYLKRAKERLKKKLSRLI